MVATLFSMRVGEAEYKLLNVFGNGDTTRLFRPVFGHCDRRIEVNTIDKVVVSKRTFHIVLNGGNLSDILIGRHLELGLGRVG